MANTTAHSSVTADKFSKRTFIEYVREHRFSPLMGATINAPLQVLMELQKGRGDGVTVNDVLRLTGSGVSNGAALRGSEEAMNNYGHKISLYERANAVSFTRWAQQLTEIDFLMAAKEVIKNWAKDQLRSDIIKGLESVDGTTALASETEANKDAWIDNQNPASGNVRVLFGAATSNSTIGAGDHSADLANVDSTNDVLSEATLTLIRRLAMLADPHIRPVRLKNGEEYFIDLVHSYPFRDLISDTQIIESRQYAMPRGKDNPLFVPGDVLWNGVICKEVPEINIISGAGASSIDVAGGYLLGAQCVGIAYAKTLKMVVDQGPHREYDREVGVGASETLGVEKLLFNSVQNMVTHYNSAVGD